MNLSRLLVEENIGLAGFFNEEFLGNAWRDRK
jgi:hypothetical protein